MRRPSDPEPAKKLTASSVTFVSFERGAEQPGEQQVRGRAAYGAELMTVDERGTCRIDQRIKILPPVRRETFRITLILGEEFLEKRKIRSSC